MTERLREAVRALVIDADDNVLLVRLIFDRASLPEGFWVCPGGGVEPGETHAQALRRELAEEVGVELESLGPLLWRKRTIFDIGDYDGQLDHVYLQRFTGAHTRGSAGRPTLASSARAAEGLVEVRWFSPDELSCSTDVFAPRTLPQLMRHVVEHGPPEQPWELTGF
ncbi:NUDIX domain-containing protein [Williamsia sp. CHRR-6]|uniref:NUDIX domain-containing protein n=1 Tax=Williamsia sp. CHRR-6 TaxID=2835871 RepID=UPI001BD9E131|nr:NUDIX domain-containing protein [Williamsia sp. CHRR-6]MBT0566209.1 NUDIX domain-containing protein [Williamsia sp. CHRR-6]